MEAEPLLRRALSIQERSFGPDHPLVANRLNNLATVLQATNRLSESGPLFHRSLEILENSFGLDHPEVARCLNNLGNFYKATNRLADAEPLARRTLEILYKITRSTGHPHPQLELVTKNYTSLLQEMGTSQEEITARLREIAPEFSDDDEDLVL